MNFTLHKNWKTVPAEEFCIKVADGTHDSPKQSEVGRFLVTSKNIKNGILDISSSYKISEEDFNDINKRSKVDQWDILFSMIGTVGEACVIREDPNFAIKNVGLFKCGDKDKALFLYYFLSSKQGREIALGLLNGTTQKYITLGELRKFPISIPESIDDQREIAAILGSLDDKIELLRRESKTLESIAQALFREWFVEFRFFGYEKVKVVDGVPEGWKVGKLGEFIDLRGGLSYDGNLISDKGVPMLTMGFVSGMKRFEWSGLRFYKGPYKDQNKVKVGDLIIATRDVTQDRVLIGSPALIPNLLSGQDIIAATNLYIVENINYLTNKFIYWLMKTPDYRERIVGACKGTTIVMITKDSILEYEFVIPPAYVAKKFDEINDQILNKCEMIDSEIQTLSRLRDQLLDKIFSN